MRDTRSGQMGTYPFYFWRYYLYLKQDVVNFILPDILVVWTFYLNIADLTSTPVSIIGLNNAMLPYMENVHDFQKYKIKAMRVPASTVISTVCEFAHFYIIHDNFSVPPRFYNMKNV